MAQIMNSLLPNSDLKKVGKTTRSFKYDLNQIPYDYKFHEVKTQIKDIVFDIRNESNPCSLCSKMRKGAFNDAAKSFGCNKAAYAHHMDDVIETALMSLIYEGHFYCFAPVTYLDRMDITLIRPLIYVDECDVIGFKNLYDLPLLKNPCPHGRPLKADLTQSLWGHVIAKLRLKESRENH